MVFFCIINQFMKVSNTPALNVTIMQEDRGILNYMWRQFMKVSSTPAQNVTIMQQHQGILNYIWQQFMKVLNTWIKCGLRSNFTNYGMFILYVIYMGNIYSNMMPVMYNDIRNKWGFRLKFGGIGFEDINNLVLLYLYNKYKVLIL